MSEHTAFIVVAWRRERSWELVLSTLYPGPQRPSRGCPSVLPGGLSRCVCRVPIAPREVGGNQRSRASGRSQLKGGLQTSAQGQGQGDRKPVQMSSLQRQPSESRSLTWLLYSTKAPESKAK